MAWEPMTQAEAAEVLEATPKAGSMGAAGFARFTEAFMVNAGRDPEDTRSAVEKILGHPVE